MRRILGGLAVFLGIVALVIGLNANGIYHRLAKVPLDMRTRPVSEGTGVSILSITRPEGSTALKVEQLTDQKVTNTRNIIGIPGQVPEDERDSTAYWQVGFQTGITGGPWLDRSEDGVSIDRTTGMATNCCGDYASTPGSNGVMQRGEIAHEGLFFKFPFDAQRRTYPFWDAQLRRAVDAEFVRTDTLQGLDVNVYRQRIPTTRLPGTRPVPRSWYGSTEPGDVASSVDYANTRTFWVEPATGVIIKGQEQIDRRLVSDLGTITLVKGTIGYDGATQRAYADEYGPKARQITFVRDLLGPIGVVTGLLLTVLGLVLIWRQGRPRRAQHREPEPEKLDVIGAGHA
ncbi:DUF3068 domain-containing protein [Arsenicicoccus dermatophilus]|uniref:DUF3068 domain-containing protein n=1 Tax=Arsenicicoccus dermatophilus TaxID=1076331 RepID=UPI0039172E57